MTKVALPDSCDASSSINTNADQYLSSGKSTIALVDSRPLIREGLARLLNESEDFKLMTVSGCSELLGKGLEVLSEIEIVLLNIGSAAISDPGIVRNIDSLKEALLKASIMIICDREDPGHIAQALRQGIRGYISTTLTSRILIRAISLVQAGGTFIPACVLTGALLQKPIVLEAAKVEVMVPDFFGLTRRQWEVLNQLRQGRQNKVIAHELKMRESTVKVHIRQIMRKMQVNNRTEAALLAGHMRNKDGSKCG